MQIYSWGNSLRTTGSGITLNAVIDPQAAGEAIEAVREQKGGTFDFQDVLDVASDREHVLHRTLNWDDVSCGHKYRLEQVKLLIRSLVVKVETRRGQEAARAFVKVAPREGGISSLSVAMADPESRDHVLNQALQQLRAWRRKWGVLSRYADIVEVVSAVDQGIFLLQDASAN